MKLSKLKTPEYKGFSAWLPAILWFWTLMIISVPNFGLEITDTLLPDTVIGFWMRITYIALPVGCYMTVMSLTHKVGKAFWMMFPLIFLSAFQLVLLDLFGTQPIAVDMWLNLVTTNATEATELLGSMTISIVMLAVFYIPAIITACIATHQRWRVNNDIVFFTRVCGLILSSLGLGATIFFVVFSWFTPYHVSLRKSLYPVNVVYNAYLAADRTIKVADYHNTSADFTYNATSTRPDSLPEIYVVVIGETARADHFQLFGYRRPTTPELLKRCDRLAYFPNTLSESNTTHKSVPMLLSNLDARTFEHDIYSSKGLLTAFDEAGYRTMFISNQGRNGSFIDFFGDEADITIFLHDDEDAKITPHDMDMIAPFKSALKSFPRTKLAIVLHSYGSHFKYDDRYPADFDTPFPVVGRLEAKPSDRENLINAYDNTIAYTDILLSTVMDLLEESGRPAALVYAADHGEDIYDDELQRFLHASPLPTMPQVHVPMIVWCSKAYDSVNPEVLSNARAIATSNVSSSRSLFHTIIDLAGIKSPAFCPDQSVVNKDYLSPTESLYLNDHNEAVKLDDIILTP